ncbi:MAG: hypothetical protein QM764_18065 [Chitinophagaceae bacterium]
MKKLFLFALIVSIAIMALKCTKSDRSDKSETVSFKKIEDPLLLLKVKNFQDESMKEGIRVFSFDAEKDGVKLNSRFENQKVIAPGPDSRVVCGSSDVYINNFIFGVRYYGDCIVAGNYTAEQTSIRLLASPGGTLLSTTNIPVKITYGSTVITTLANAAASGPAVYILTVNDFPFNDYCTLTDVDVTCTVQVKCSSGAIVSGDVTATANISSNRSIICKSISPAFFQPNVGGNGTVGLNGWYPCSNPALNPCVAYAEGIEFQYRIVGTTSWTTSPLNPYLYNAYQVSGLASGNYEYRYRNIDYSTGTAVACYGPYTSIKTVHIN